MRLLSVQVLHFLFKEERNDPQRKDFRWPAAGGCSSLETFFQNKDAVPIVWLGWITPALCVLAVLHPFGVCLARPKPSKGTPCSSLKEPWAI